jgi:RNA polymerase sigma-70 factor, ECF subfamily
VDTDSFDRFYGRTARRLLRYTYAMCGDLRMAQQLTHEVLIRGVQRWPQLSEYEYPEAWLRFTTTRLINDRWRWLTVRGRGPAETTMDAQRAPETVGAEQLLAALRRLPLVQRRALAMHYLADLSIAELADETGVSMTTVTSWLSRGMGNLASLLAAADADGPDHAGTGRGASGAGTGPDHAGTGPEADEAAVEARFVAVRIVADGAELVGPDEVRALAGRRTRVRRRVIAIGAAILLVGSVVLVVAWGHITSPVLPQPPNPSGMHGTIPAT